MLIEQIELLIEHSDLIWLNLIAVTLLGAGTGGIAEWIKSA